MDFIKNFVFVYSKDAKKKVKYIKFELYFYIPYQWMECWLCFMPESNDGNVNGITRELGDVCKRESRGILKAMDH